MNRKTLIAMSGGVDSSVAAYLMLQKGHSCIGATMRLFNNAIIGAEEESTCCSLDDVEDARAVAYRLGIPFYVFNFSDEFESKVIRKFVSCYECGLTPNPCIDCNRYLKFESLYQRALTLGYDSIATGHYARVIGADNGRYILAKAADSSKDQSYFLYNLTQQELSGTYFPLGELTKAEVREIAQSQGFLNAHKHDSQDICFVPDGDYMRFLQSYTGKVYDSGPFLDLQGNIIGTHHGAAGYTLGQRKGLGVAAGAPVYVCCKDMEKNTVTLGPNEVLFRSTVIADDWNWFPFASLTEPLRCKAKTRSRMAEQPGTVYPMADGRAKFVFDEPQRAITPGQALVLYDGDMVIGGGTILCTE